MTTTENTSVQISNYSKSSALRLFYTLSLRETHIFAFKSRTEWVRFYKSRKGWKCAQFVDGQPTGVAEFKDINAMGVGMWKYIVDSKMIQGGKNKVFKPFNE